MDFTTALKAAKEQHGMTQTEFGKALHVSFSTIIRYENRHHMPTPMILYAMKALFEKTISLLSMIPLLIPGIHSLKHMEVYR